MGLNQLTIIAHNQLGILERILRVIRHRGGRITAINMQLRESNIININIVLESQRPIELLKKQLIKLVDVINIDDEHYSNNH
ncbi:acetolactate synthase 2 small subunit [Candidatus Schmidhempelia bombi]|jgi:acetolactate synthase II small subunit|uniref:Acetolactate synthase 2 small subunit n=1 Tax=Candidatus Schmidhempelia bombi str. Bimp TaxID=1387197 RepID=A0AB94IAK7_9GAMM|nr:acetolactate synthase 2 small subunit [Candidatus Schmidhempelia bombi]TEA26416.1 acetolactate synthase 2 small subunit [Candidatus Schmidhempelia bombi str. Bimp]